MGSHSGHRSVEERYQYFVRGRQLIIIEQKETVTSTAGNDEPSYQTPSETITAGLMLEYTSIPDLSSMTDEQDDIPLNDVLALAVIDYMRGATAEEPAMREYYMEKFNKRVVRYVEGRVGGIRRIMPNSMMR